MMYDFSYFMGVGMLLTEVGGFVSYSKTLRYKL